VVWAGGGKVGDAGAKTGGGGRGTAGVATEGVPRRSMEGLAGNVSRSSSANRRIRRFLRLFELLSRLGGWPSSVAGAGAGGGGGGGAVESLGAREVRVVAGAPGAGVLDGRNEIR
jgi:hypothetical protein